MADLIYNSFKERMGDNTIDMDNDTFKVMLTTSSYTPAATHTTTANVTNEVSGTGYTTGGATLTSVTWNAAGATVTFDAADVQWTSASFTARYAVVYSATGSNSVVCCVDFSEDKTVASGTFTLTWNASGILTLS